MVANSKYQRRFENPKYVEFGERFSRAMDASGIKAVHLKQALGLSPEMVRRYRMGASFPRDVAGVARALGVPAPWLAFGEGELGEQGSARGAAPLSPAIMLQIEALSPKKREQLEVMLEGLLKGLNMST